MSHNGNIRISRKAELIGSAETMGLYVRTYSPGDGGTRYRFFKAEPCKNCGLIEAADDCVDFERGIYHNSQPNGYFGPANGIYTAMGIKEAEAFLSGYNAARR